MATNLFYTKPYGFETITFKIKNAVVVVVFIFLKYNGLCGRLADSTQMNYYSAQIFVLQITVHTICEARPATNKLWFLFGISQI